MNLTLVVMAAGMGSRYGGLKQIEPVGPSGEIIMEYSIYDAIKAGFDKVVFIIKKEMEETFRENVGYKIEKKINTQYVFQDINQLPKDFKVPVGRTKPWGTAHAVLACKDVVCTPFAVINADDFYGATSFQMLGQFLKEKKNGDFYHYCMVGFELWNTLTENGHVARGVCRVDANQYLTDIVERTYIEKQGQMARYTTDGENFYTLERDTIVSMNTWGFTPTIFHEIEKRFPAFLQKNDMLKAEFYLPFVVDMLIRENKAKVKVLPCKERWYGVTYKEDRDAVVKAIHGMVEEKRYPRNLWAKY